MINSLRIQEYKCFSDQTLPLRVLTLLAGANATGKSTVLQSLLLLRQSHLRSTLAHGELLLNGPLINVGTALDAVNETAVTDTVAFTLRDNDGCEQRFAFDYPRGAGESYTLRGVPDVSYNTNHCLFVSRFNYLHAERVGPRVLYPMSEMIEDLIDVGIHGEYTAHCLDRFGSTPIPNPDLVHSESTSSRLLFDQTRYWMSEIVPDLDIDLKAITEADQMRIGLKTSTGRFLRPTDIGFGIIYTLPVIVTALLSPPGSLLIVENPEAHLHPASQSRIGHFLARGAAAGVQVIIETHSDHVLNGIRRAVRSGVMVSWHLKRFHFSSSAIAPVVLRSAICRGGSLVDVARTSVTAAAALEGWLVSLRGCSDFPRASVIVRYCQDDNSEEHDVVIIHFIEQSDIYQVCRVYEASDKHGQEASQNSGVYISPMDLVQQEAQKAHG